MPPQTDGTLLPLNENQRVGVPAYLYSITELEPLFLVLLNQLSGPFYSFVGRRVYLYNFVVNHDYDTHHSCLCFYIRWTGIATIVVACSASELIGDLSLAHVGEYSE